jgi:hypothetical protein
MISRNQVVSCKSTELLTMIEKKVVSELFEFEQDEHMIDELLLNAPKSLEDRKFMFSLNKKAEPEILKKEESSISMEIDVHSIHHSAKLMPMNGKQVKLLFKDLFDEDIDFDKLLNGHCWDEFYKKTYSKFNNLEPKQASKRKKVCKKLLQILKILVIFINLASISR